MIRFDYIGPTMSKMNQTSKKHMKSLKSLSILDCNLLYRELYIASKFDIINDFVILTIPEIKKS